MPIAIQRQAPALRRRASMNDFTHIPTYTAMSTAMMDCATTAAGRATSPPDSRVGSFIKPDTVPRNPSNPTVTAMCMAILRRFSSRASAPKITSNRPNAAGISAVRLTLSVPKYPPKPSTMSTIPNPMVVFAKFDAPCCGIPILQSNCLSMPDCVVLSHMKPATYLLLAAALPLCAQVKITQHTDRISVEIDGKPFTDLFVGADTTKPYLWP